MALCLSDHSECDCYNQQQSPMPTNTTHSNADKGELEELIARRLETAQIRLLMKKMNQRELKARLDTLDNLIDIESKQFSQWTKNDIAHFFDTVGKQYREIEADLAQAKETEKE